MTRCHNWVSECVRSNVTSAAFSRFAHRRRNSVRRLANSVHSSGKPKMAGYELKLEFHFWSSIERVYTRMGRVRQSRGQRDASVSILSSRSWAVISRERTDPKSARPHIESKQLI